MTEQEKREKAIDKMCNLICEQHQHCSMNRFKYCEIDEACKKLYDAGYRKEEEVRKETAVANML